MGTSDAPDRLDALVHHPARLLLLTALTASAAGRADYQALLTLTGLSDGNLSAHLGKLAAAGLIEREKGYRGTRPFTTVRLTAAGRRATVEHWRRLELLRARATDWAAGSVG